MKRFNLELREIDTKQLKRFPAQESDTERIADEPGVYLLGGKPAIIYGKLGDRYDRMLWAVKSLHYQTSTRTNGLKTTSRIFGFRPRIPLRSDFCSSTSMTHTHPTQHKIICEFGQLLASIYREYAPQTFDSHCEHLKTVRSEWVIPGSPFTSGIVNQNNQLKYHFDTGNFENVFSCMVVFRKDCEGGFLSMPALNTKFFLGDHTFLLFDGQAILHGVTPMNRMTKTAYRYSVVYYALRSMAQCLPCEEELKRIRITKRVKEMKRR